MSSSTAELTLILKAQNLAKGALADVKTAIGGIEAKAKTAGTALSTAFAGKGAILARELGNLVTNIFNGQDFSAAAVNLGATLAGGAAAAFGEQLIAKLAGTALVQSIAAGLAGLGTSLVVAGEGIGALIAAAIPIGMAALPFILVGALVAAIAVLVLNPEIRDKVFGFAGGVIKWIVDGLIGLGSALLGVFAAAFKLVVDATVTVVTSIVGFYLSIPGRILGLGAALLGVIGDALRGVLDLAKTVVGQIVSIILGIPDAVAKALASLAKLPGDTRGLASDRYGVKAPGSAAGGWVGLNGPEIRLLGEKGPEYVTPNDQLGGRGGSGAGVRILGVTEEDIVDMVDRGLYFRLSRSAPTEAR